MNLEYKRFKEPHPDYLGPYFEILMALESGGRRLFGNARAMKQCLRANLVEGDDVYRERSARAVYPPYAAEIIGQLVAGVFADPLTAALESDGAKPAETPEDWAEWFEDVSKAGSSIRVPIHQHMRAILHRLLVCGVAYTLVDFPSREAELDPVTLAQEEALGLRRPYLIDVDPCAVVEWEDDNNGDLVWVMIKSVEARRVALADDRDMVTESFRVIDREKWELWAITYSRRDYPNGPLDTDQVHRVATAPHTFGRVPLVRHKVTSGLWAMDRMYSQLCSLFRGVSGYNWIRDKTNCPAPYLKLQNLKTAEESPDAAVESQGVGRAHGGRVGELYILGERDDLGWSAPPPEPLKETRDGNRDAVSELHRTMDAMAQAIDPSAASNKQSGESKAMDASSRAVLQKALGEVARAELLTVLRVVEAGRGDEPAEWIITGCDEVEQQTAGEVVADLGALELVQLPPTFRVAEIMRAFGIRHPYATDAERERVREEAEANSATDQEVKDKETTDTLDAPAPHEQEMALKKAGAKKGPPFGKGR